MKRALVLLALLLGTASGMPVQAAPSVDRVAAATAEFALKDAQGVAYLFDLTARVSELGTSAASGRIEVSVRRCKASTCTAGSSFAARLKPSQLRVASDLSTGVLETQLFGLPLSVGLKALGTEETLDGQAELYQPVLPTGQVRIWVSQSRETTAAVTVLQRRCRASSSLVSREQIIDGVALDLPAALPTRIPPALASLKTARC